jgi:hypothetical protein
LIPHSSGLGDRLQRDVQHRVVQHDGDQADDQHAEDGPATAVDAVSGSGLEIGDAMFH